MPSVEELLKEHQSKKPPQTGSIDDLLAQSRAQQFQQQGEDFAGVPVDVSQGANFAERLSGSFARTPLDIQQRFMEQNKNGVIEPITTTVKNEPSRTRDPNEVQAALFGGAPIRTTESQQQGLLFKRDASDPNEKAKFFDAPTVETGDIADLAGPSLPVLTTIATTKGAGGAAVATHGALRRFFTGITARTAAGEVSGQAAKGAVNQYLGANTGFFDEARGALSEAAFNTLFAAGLGITQKALGKNININAETAQQLSDVDAATEAFNRDGNFLLDENSLFGAQLAPDSPVLGRFQQQATRISGPGVKRLRDQELAAKKSLFIDRAKLSQMTPQQVARQLQKIASKSYRDTANQYRSAVVQTKFREAETNLVEALRKVDKKAKNKVNALYAKVDEAAEIEQPVFNWGRAQEGLKEIETELRRALPKKGEELVDVTGGPNGELLGIIQDMRKIGNTQTDYRVVKDIRTRLFNAGEHSPLAKRLWLVVNDVWVNPASDAPSFLQRATEAGAAHAARVQTLSNLQVQEIIRRTTNTGELIKRFGDVNTLDSTVMRELSKVNPKKLQLFKDATTTNAFLDPRNNGRMVEQLQQMSERDLQQWAFLTGSKITKTGTIKNSKRANSLFRAALELDDLDQNIVKRMFDPNTNGRNLFAQTFIGADKAQTAAAIKLMPKEAKDLMRLNAYDELISRSLQVTEEGLPRLNTQAMANAIKEYQDSGVWTQLLNSNDRVKLKGIASFLSVRSQTRADVGTSLELASAISQLKSPDTFLAGARELTANKLFAIMLMNDKTSAFIRGRVSATSQNANLIRTLSVIEAIHDAATLTRTVGGDDGRQ